MLEPPLCLHQKVQRVFAAHFEREAVLVSDAACQGPQLHWSLVQCLSHVCATSIPLGTKKYYTHVQEFIECDFFYGGGDNVLSTRLQ